MNATHILRTNGVYMIKNLLNGKIYIGFSKRDIRERIYAHFGNLEKGRGNRLMQEDWNIDSTCWETSLVEITDDPSREVFWINYYQSNLSGYNIDIGHKKVESTKQRISENHVGNTGRKFSEDHKNKLKELRQRDADSRAETASRNKFIKTMKFYKDHGLRITDDQKLALTELTGE
jgi:hypothetical protein